MRNKVRRQRQVKREPEHCPACEGKGIVPYGFYGDQSATTQPDEDQSATTQPAGATAVEPCRGCGGTGIITTPMVVKQEREQTA